MPLKHRLARLEAASAARKRPIDERNSLEETQRIIQELHADPVQLQMLRDLHEIADERKLPLEQLGDDPEAAQIIGRLKAHLAAKEMAACA